MDNSGLLFIPDISGFTKFVNETEIDHSRYIISELLENIIDSNQIGLTVSEIEGDAVLFYRFGNTPSIKEIYQQVEKTFCNFQKQLKNYETRRACQCSACIAAVNLSLKVITHYGEFSTYSIQRHHKLIGKDVIVAHQLLKNDIELHEYWLLSGNVFKLENGNTDLPGWINWEQGNKQTDKGDVTFHYSMLSKLKEKVQPDPIKELDLTNKIKVISTGKAFNAPVLKVLSLIGNLYLRPDWMEGIKSVDKLSHPINHVGVKHNSIFNNRAITWYSSSFSQTSNTFSYSETDERETTTIFFTVRSVNSDNTFVTIDYYLKKEPLTQLYFSIFLKNKLSKQLSKSLNNLDRLSRRPDMGYTASA
jgi:hypothetical protein